ncbi:MAG: Holliday junction branch migration protein RuvA [Candidatus Zapsychrus exili]|nr:Holliday junction branch migration protein RuvA [Candidatus Zapsychrus exili]
MIVKIKGKLVEKKEQSVVVDVSGLFYEIVVSASVLNRIEETLDENNNIGLIVYHYFQLNQSSGNPILIGFINEIEKDFFLQFIKVSGIGPRAAIKALNKPISEITRAIDREDFSYLKTLPGIGLQRAKEIVAKLQGKVGRFGLIRDEKLASDLSPVSIDWQEEALNVLIQLQYKKQEANAMIKKAIERGPDIKTTEELLNEIYKQRV